MKIFYRRKQRKRSQEHVCLMVSQLFIIGDQPMQAFVGARYYAEKPAGGPDWGIRMGLTFLFLK